MFTSNTTYNIKGFDLTGMGLGSFNGFGSCGIGGFGMDMMNLGGFYDTSAMMGWGIASSIFTMGSQIACTAVQAHKTQKAADAKVLNTAKSNVSSLTAEIKKLQTENTTLGDYKKNIDNHIGRLVELFPEAGKAYKEAKATFDGFKKVGSETEPLNETSREAIAAQRAIVNDNTKTDEQKEAAKKEITKIEAECRTAYIKAKQAVEQTKKTLEEAIQAKLDKNAEEIKKKQTDLEEAKEKLNEIGSTEIDDALNAADGTGLSRLFGGNKDNQKLFREFRTKLDTFRSMQDGDAKKKLGNELHKLGETITTDEKITSDSDKTTQVAISHIENWLKGEGAQYKNQ